MIYSSKRMLVLGLALAGLFAVGSLSPAEARSHHRHHHAHHARSFGTGSLTTIDGCQGLHLRVAAEHAGKFQGFFCDLPRLSARQRGDTACQAFGHMPGSKHDWGGACDVAQKARNRTAGFMYHISALAAKHGLHDGCSFHDCGHVEVPGSNSSARNEHYGRQRVASGEGHHSRYHHYARRGPTQIEQDYPVVSNY